MRLFVLLATTLFFILPINAQSEAELQDKVTNNSMGLMFTDLFNGSYLLNYERALGKHTTARLNFGYKGENGLIALSGLDTDKIQTGDIKYSGTRILPEFRY